MELFNKVTTIDFLGKRKISSALSIALVLACIFSIFSKGLNLSIDFTGGSIVEVTYEQPANLSKIRETLAENGYSKSVVQNFGSVNDVMIRVPVAEESEVASDAKSNGKISEKVFNLLSLTAVEGDSVTLRRIEFVGPQFGKELVEGGILALLYALGFVMIYVAFRFEWKFGIGSVVALMHDVIITIGIFAMLQLEFSLSVLAAVLAVIGYSLNDTIVVFDRIRENFRKVRETDTVKIMNLSVNETLPRTILTSLTTLLVLVALYVYGGASLQEFSIALIIGVLIGTYSSVFVASPVVLALGVSKQDLIQEVVEKEGVDQVDLDMLP